ncbi:YfhH family protein [Sporosarcina sp. GW1-11]|uniref:YfhH family protein n=1 Tax=Sporosarcina sp. GW1-11 TaxID=2899126 RepID=UPI00294FA1F1|nr:YfhH family protein [Sporosarcina sp. GW1-11]MDV6379295.1 YfhH family protein [Sporosarcina sp. GW1-11]
MATEKHYSEMNENELRTEIGLLMEKARKAEQMGMLSEYAVHQRKAVLVQSYLVDPATIVPGEIYRIEGDTGVFFQVDYLKGLFAWGHRLGGEKAVEALPLAMLKDVKSGK